MSAVNEESLATAPIQHHQRHDKADVQLDNQAWNLVPILARSTTLGSRQICMDTMMQPYTEWRPTFDPLWVGHNASWTKWSRKKIKVVTSVMQNNATPTHPLMTAVAIVQRKGVWMPVWKTRRWR